MRNKLLPLQWTIHHYITLIVDCTPFKCLVSLFILYLFFVLQDGAHYMIYTPSDPLLFVAVKVLFLICSYK